MNGAGLTSGARMIVPHEPPYRRGLAALRTTQVPYEYGSFCHPTALVGFAGGVIYPLGGGACLPPCRPQSPGTQGINNRVQACLYNAVALRCTSAYIYITYLSKTLQDSTL